MPDLTIHAVAQEDLDALDARATRHGRSTENEALHLIREAAAAERLVQQLERAQRAEDAIRRAEQRKGTRGPTTARPRYRIVEPTPHRTRHDPPPAAVDVSPNAPEKAVP